MKQDLACITPKKRLSSTLGNKEILERHYTQTNPKHENETQRIPKITHTILQVMFTTYV